MGHWSVLGTILLLHVYVSCTLVRYTRLPAVSVYEHFMNCACFDVVLCIPNICLDGNQWTSYPRLQDMFNVTERDGGFRCHNILGNFAFWFHFF